MAGRFVSRGFVGKRRQEGAAGRVPLDQWRFTIEGLVREPASWSWREFLQLPSQTFTVDIHCVTKWSKLDTRWEGVSVDTLLEHVELDPKARFATAHCYGGYTTNLPLTELLNGQ